MLGNVRKISDFVVCEGLRRPSKGHITVLHRGSLTAPKAWFHIDAKSRISYWCQSSETHVFILINMFQLKHWCVFVCQACACVCIGLCHHCANVCLCCYKSMSVACCFGAHTYHKLQYTFHYNILHACAIYYGVRCRCCFKAMSLQWVFRAVLVVLVMERQLTRPPSRAHIHTCV